MVERRDGEWLERGESTLYASDWVSLHLTDVVLPDGTQVDHHVVRMPRPAAGTVMVSDGHVLLLYRHRFITASWGWEIPAGGVDAGESSAQAAVREAREESGWEPASVEHLCTFFPANGLLDQAFHIYVSRDPVHVGEPVDRNEAARVEWVPAAELRTLLRRGEIADGLSFGALSYALAMDELA